MRTVGSLEWREEVPDRSFTWEEAKAYAESMGDGWRLPTVQELLTLVDYAKYRPACSVFPDCPSVYFWSSSAYAGSTLAAWLVSFGGGYALYNHVGNDYRVRLVRDAKPAVENVPDTVAAVGGRAPTNWERVLCAGIEQMTRERDTAYLRGVEAMRVAANRVEAERSALRAENEKLRYEVNWLKEAGAKCDAEIVLHEEARVRLRTEVERLTRERDEALAEVERLRAAPVEPADCRECEVEAKSHALTRIERDEALKEAAAWRATARDKGESSRQAAAERDALRAEVERLRGLTPEPSPRLPDGEGLPRYGLRWNSPTEPLAVPMRDGYWTPWHLADAEVAAAYRCGAEAMREAAAGEVCGYSVTVTDPLGRRVTLDADGLGALAEAIRALPMPEDKS